MRSAPISCTYESNLKKKVIDGGLCCSCGTCGAVCPKLQGARSTNPVAGSVRRARPDAEEECSLCLDVCPMSNQVEERGLGNVISIWRARANDEGVLERCQDGGACTAFLVSLEDYRCLGIGRSEWVPHPMLDNIKDMPGSKYGATASLSVLPLRGERLAFVGLPCQMQGIELARRKGLMGEVGLRVGLFCYKNFYHTSFNDVLLGEGIKLEDIVKVDVKKDVVVTLQGGSSTAVPLARFDGAVIEGCRSCLDLCSFCSDISFGSVGTEDGYTTVIVRTKRAEELFESCMQKEFITADRKVDERSIRILQGQKRKNNG